MATRRGRERARYRAVVARPRRQSIRRYSWSLFIVLAGAVCSAAPALARVGASDAAATHGYLEAKIAWQRVAMANEPAALNAITALATRVHAECPGVLAGAPPHIKGEKTNQSEVEVSQELLAVAFGASDDVQHPADERFSTRVRRLHWSNSKLTKLLHSLAAEQAAQSGIPSPDLCADLKFWVASGYTTASASTKLFLHRMMVVSSITVIESEPHEPVADFFDLDALVAYRLKPYEDHTDRLLAKKAFPPEAKLTDPAVRPFLEAVGNVYKAVGRLPAPASPAG